MRGVRASGSSVSAEQTSRFRQTRQLQKNEIGLGDIVFNLALSMSMFNTRNVNRQDLQPFLLFLRSSPLPVFGFDGETLLGGSQSKIHVLNISFNRPESIVLVKQSASIADVSIQRG